MSKLFFDKHFPTQNFLTQNSEHLKLTHSWLLCFIVISLPLFAKIEKYVIYDMYMIFMFYMYIVNIILNE